MASPPQRVNMAMRLSTLVYSKAEVLDAWLKGRSVTLTDSGLVFGEEFLACECTPKTFVAVGSETETQEQHKVQWLACEADGVLYVAFRGTMDVSDMVLDASMPEMTTPTGMRVHAGFYSGVQGELPAVLELCNTSPCAKVVFTGHSLGGALATVALYELCASVVWAKDRFAAEAVTFGAPLGLCTGQGDGGVVPAVFADRPPRVLNVVNNYDIIPRGAALRKEDFAGALLEAPKYLGGFCSYVFNMARSSGLVKIDELVASMEDMRKVFRPTGIYLFAQSCSAVRPDGGSRATSASFIADPTDIYSLLQYYPGVSSKDLANDRGAFVTESINDHGIGSYWPMVDQICSDGALWATGYADAVAEHDAACRSAEEQQLQAYRPQQQGIAASGFLLPPASVVEHMAPEDQERLRRLQHEAMALLAAAAEAKAAALKARQVAIDGRGAPQPTVSVAHFHPAGSLRSEVHKLKAKLKSPSPSPTSEKSLCPSGKVPIGNRSLGYLGKLTNFKVINPAASKALETPVEELAVTDPVVSVIKTSLGLACLDPAAKPVLVVNMTDRGVKVRVPCAAAKASAAEQTFVVAPHAAADVACGDMVGTLECTFDEDHAVRVTVPKVSAGEAACYLLQDSALLVGLVVEGRVVKAQREFSVVKTVGDIVPRLLRLHDLAALIKGDASEALRQCYAINDPSPAGMGVPETKFQNADSCGRCLLKFTTGMGVLNPFASQRHHCRACGESVCVKCSPHVRVLERYGKDQPVRVCVACTKALATRGSGGAPGTPLNTDPGPLPWAIASTARR